MEEIEGSGKWSIDAGSQVLEITREAVVPWAGHPAWVAARIGTPDALFPLAICRKAAIEGMGPIGTSVLGATYSHAKVVLSYVAEQPEWPTGGPPGTPSTPAGASVQIRVRGGGEFMLVPGRDVRWGDNPSGSPSQPIPNDDGNAGRVIVPHMDYVVTLGNLAGPNWERLRSRSGWVNEFTFLGYEPETVLFEAYDTDWSWTFESGAPVVKWSVTWHFKMRRIKRDDEPLTEVYGWNHEYRADGWVRVLMDGKDRYPKANFSNIFL